MHITLRGHEGLDGEETQNFVGRCFGILTHKTKAEP